MYVKLINVGEFRSKSVIHSPCRKREVQRGFHTSLAVSLKGTVQGSYLDSYYIIIGFYCNETGCLLLVLTDWVLEMFHLGGLMLSSASLAQILYSVQDVIIAGKDDMSSS